MKIATTTMATAKDALQDVRRSVRVLRTKREPFACTQGITLLVEQLRENALVVDFEVDGSEERFSGEALMTLYRRRTWRMPSRRGSTSSMRRSSKG
jgi:signal transduction histidine kinase